MAQITNSGALDVLIAIRNGTNARSDDEEHRYLNHCLRHAAGSYAQFLQDIWVTFELPNRKNGFFVEFGAAGGVEFSNTCLLERELGWNGILAEPAQVYYPALPTARNCFVDRRCVWTKTGERLLFNQPDIWAHATIDAYSDSDGWADTRKDGQRYEVETVSLTDLLDHWGAPRRIDYMSADTEGSEFDILSAFDFDRYDVRLISVEHNHTPKRDEIFALLTSKGYRRKFEALSFVDDWYVKTYE
jgi:hypothetical protein